MFFLKTYVNTINTIGEKLYTFCKAYVDTLSMGIGEAPLWSLIFSVVLIIEMYRILQYMAVAVPVMLEESMENAKQVNAYIKRKLGTTAKVKNHNDNK